MKAIKKKILLVVLLAAALAAVWKLKAPQEENISLAQTNLEAADELLSAYYSGQDSLLFYSQEITEKKVFHLLQAQSPYMATLNTASYPNGRLEFTYEIPRRQEQDTGLDEARQQGRIITAQETDITKKLEIIHDEVVRSCIYAENGEDVKRGYMAAGVMEDGKAICAGYARAFQAMCEGAGLDVYYVEDDDMTHAWNVVRLYGKTYFIDCTYDDPVPDQGALVSRKYFMLTAQQLRTDHTWDEELYEQFLDEKYPEDFAFIQRMQDLQLADPALQTADTDREATEEELDKLNSTLGITVADSVTRTAEDGTETKLTCGELYHMGYDALWNIEDSGERVAERLIDDHLIPVLTARSMGF